VNFVSCKQKEHEYIANTLSFKTKKWHLYLKMLHKEYSTCKRGDRVFKHTSHLNMVTNKLHGK
jgi:hypothetical protein